MTYLSNSKKQITTKLVIDNLKGNNPRLQYVN